MRLMKLRWTGRQLYQWLREVCSTKLLQNLIVLGGEGKLFKLMRHSFVTSKVVFLISNNYNNGMINYYCILYFQHHRGHPPQTFDVWNSWHFPTTSFGILLQQEMLSLYSPLLITMKCQEQLFTQTNGLPIIEWHHCLMRIVAVVLIIQPHFCWSYHWHSYSTHWVILE